MLNILLRLETINSTNKQLAFEFLKVLFLLIPGYYFGSEMYYLALIPLILYQKRSTLKEQFQVFREKPFIKKHLISVWLIAVILLVGIILKFLRGATICSLRDYYSAFMLLPFLFLIAKDFFTETTKKVIIGFVLLEIFVALFEFLTAQRTLFFQEEIKSVFSYDSLYKSRVYGFASNSPIFALRIFIALTFIYQVQFKVFLKVSAYLILLIGILVSFNRTIILISFLYIFLGFIRSLLPLLKNGIKQVKSVEFIQFSLLLLVFLVSFQIPYLKYSFTKGESSEKTEVPDTWKMKENHLVCADQHTIEMKDIPDLNLPVWMGVSASESSEKMNTSGRTIIWLNFMNFILEHPLNGNGTHKVSLRILNKKREIEYMHAHNSFLQYAATNGLIMLFLMCLLLFLKWNWKNSILIFCIIIYSQLQYGIFWGISLLDIYFIYLICSTKNSLPFGNNRANSEN